jgi:hypothetical protein
MDQATANLKALALINLKTLERNASKIRSRPERARLIAFIRKSQGDARKLYDEAWRTVYTVGIRVNDRYTAQDCPLGGACSRDYQPSISTYLNRANSLLTINKGISTWFQRLKNQTKATQVTKQAQSLYGLATQLTKQIPAPKPGCAP